MSWDFETDPEFLQEFDGVRRSHSASDLFPSGHLLRLRTEAEARFGEVFPRPGEVFEGVGR